MSKVTTSSGTYNCEELKEIEEIVKQGFKDFWSNNINIKELEKIKKDSGLSHAEIQNCQYNASTEENNRKNNLDLTNFESLILSCAKYHFPIESCGNELSVMSKNTDDELIKWFSIKKVDDIHTATLYGNTDQLNIWLCDTRKDLTPDNLLDFIKSINESTLKLGIKLPLKTLVDPEDWQEISQIHDAYTDERYIMEPEDLIKENNNLEL